MSAIPSFPRRPSTAGSSASYETAHSSGPDTNSRFPTGVFFTRITPHSTPDPHLSLNSAPDLSSPSHGTVTTDDGMSSRNPIKFPFPNPSDSSTLQSGVSTPPSSASTPKTMADRVHHFSHTRDAPPPHLSSHIRHHSLVDPSIRLPHNDDTDDEGGDDFGSTPLRSWNFTPGASSLATMSIHPSLSRRTPSLRHVSKRPVLRAVSDPFTDGGVGLSSSKYSAAATAAFPRHSPSPIKDPLGGRSMRVRAAHQAPSPSNDGSHAYIRPAENSIPHRDPNLSFKSRSFTAPSTKKPTVSSYHHPTSASRSGLSYERLPSTEQIQTSHLVLEPDLLNSGTSASESPNSPCPPAQAWSSIRNSVKSLGSQTGLRSKRCSLSSELQSLPEAPEQVRSTPEYKFDQPSRHQSLDVAGVLLQPAFSISDISNVEKSEVKRKRESETTKRHNSLAHGSNLRNETNTVKTSDLPHSTFQTDRLHLGDPSEWNALNAVTRLDRVKAAVSMTETSAQDFIESGVRLHPAHTEVRTEIVSQNDDDGITTHFHHYHHYHHHHHHHHHLASRSSLRHISSDASSRAELGYAVAVPLKHITPPQTGNPSERIPSPLSEDELFFDVLSASGCSESPQDRIFKLSSSNDDVEVPRSSPNHFDRIGTSTTQTSSVVASGKSAPRMKDHLEQPHHPVSMGTPVPPCVTVVPPTPLPPADGNTTDTVVSTRVSSPGSPSIPAIVISSLRTTPSGKKGPTLASKVRRYSDTLVRAINPATSVMEKRFFNTKIRERVVQVRNRALRRDRSSSHGSFISQDSIGHRDGHLHPDWIPRSERDRLASMGIDPDYDPATENDAWTLPPGGDTSDIEDEDGDKSLLRAWSGRVKSAFSRVRKDRDREVTRLGNKPSFRATDGVTLLKPEPILFSESLDVETVHHGHGVPLIFAHGPDAERDDSPDYYYEPGHDEDLSYQYDDQPRKFPQEPISIPVLVEPSYSFYTHDNSSSTHAHLIGTSYPKFDEGRSGNDVHRSTDKIRNLPPKVNDDYYNTMGVSLNVKPPIQPLEFSSNGASLSTEFTHEPPQPIIAAPTHSPNMPTYRAVLAPPPPPSNGSSAVVVPWGESPAKPPPAPGSILSIPGPFPPSVYSSASSPLADLPSLAPPPPPPPPPDTDSLSPRVTPLIAAAPLAPPASGYTFSAPSPPSIPRCAPTPTGSYKLRPRHPPSAFVTRGFADSMGGPPHGLGLESSSEESDPWLAMSMSMGGAFSNSRDPHSSSMPIFGDEVLVGDEGFRSAFGADSVFSEQLGGDLGGFGFGMYDDIGGFSGFSAPTPESEDHDGDDDNDAEGMHPTGGVSVAA